MRIRTLVPALACLAAAPLALAADGPSVKFDGFVDTFLTSTSVEDGDGSSGFGYTGKLGVSATISEKVSAQVDLNIAGNSSGETDGNVTSRQAYGVWKVADSVELKTGKFISNYGWTAAYAPGLYRINGGPITSFYGVDQVGVDAKYTTGDLTVALTVANGFFGEPNGTGSQAAGQNNESYAAGVDVVYSLGDKGSINVEAIRDAEAGGSDADGFHLAANVTLTPSKELTVGAEVICQQINQIGGAKDGNYTGAMLLANYKLATAMPMSVTGQVTYRDVDQLVADTAGSLSGFSSQTGTEYAVALLTNPAGTDKLGANLEVSYSSFETDGADALYAIGLAGEILYVF